MVWCAWFCRSGYQLFSTEMLVKLTAIHSQQRMAVISEKWKAMTEAQRNSYKAKREKLWTKYYADLKKFKAVSFLFSHEFLVFKYIYKGICYIRVCYNVNLSTGRCSTKWSLAAAEPVRVAE